MKRLLFALLIAALILFSRPAPAAGTRAQSVPFVPGVNIPWYNFGTDLGTGWWGKFTDWRAIDGWFATLHSQGATHVAWALFCDGRYSPNFLPSGSYLNEQVFGDMDEMILLAHKHGLKLKLDLLYAGGMFGYYNYNYGAQAGAHSDIVTDPYFRGVYIDHVLAPLMRWIHANPFHADVDQVDVVDEPELVMADFTGWYPQIDTASMREFVAECADCIHANAPGIAVTVDSATPYWAGTWKGLGLDVYTLHYYPWMDFGGLPGSGLPTTASLGLDKPVYVGEYPTVDTDYAIGSSVPLSAQWYLDTILARGYAGSYAWQFSYLDGAGDWGLFQPVYSHWVGLH